MSYVRRVGKWEIENSITDNKIYISDLNGQLLAEFDKTTQARDYIHWIMERVMDDYFDKYLENMFEKEYSLEDYFKEITQ